MTTATKTGTRSAKRNAKLLERWKNVERVLKGLSKHERTRHWRMDTWGMPTACGTSCCAAGHCSLDPWFQEQGFKGEVVDIGKDWKGRPTLVFQINGNRFRSINAVVHRFFGKKHANEIFFNTGVSYDEVLKSVHQKVRELRKLVA